jgi:hypothetical protein
MYDNCLFPIVADIITENNKINNSITIEELEKLSINNTFSKYSIYNCIIIELLLKYKNYKNRFYTNILYDFFEISKKWISKYPQFNYDNDILNLINNAEPIEKYKEEILPIYTIIGSFCNSLQQVKNIINQLTHTLMIKNKECREEIKIITELNYLLNQCRRNEIKNYKDLIQSQMKTQFENLNEKHLVYKAINIFFKNDNINDMMLQSIHNKILFILVCSLIGAIVEIPTDFSIKLYINGFLGQNEDIYKYTKEIQQYINNKFLEKVCNIPLNIQWLFNDIEVYDYFNKTKPQDINTNEINYKLMKSNKLYKKYKQKILEE